jgi:hypothetical protein
LDKTIIGNSYIAKEEKARKFLTRNNPRKEEPDTFIYHARNYLLPRMAQLREYIFADDPQELEYFEILKENKLDNSLVLIETCRTKRGRREISQKTNVPDKVLLDFVSRFSMPDIHSFCAVCCSRRWDRRAIAQPQSPCKGRSLPAGLTPAFFSQLRSRAGRLPLFSPPINENCHSAVQP